MWKEDVILCGMSLSETIVWFVNVVALKLTICALELCYKTRIRQGGVIDELQGMSTALHPSLKVL